MQSQVAPAERDRPGGHQNHLLAAFVQARDVGGKAFQPGAIHATLVRIDQQGRAHLDDDAFGERQGLCGGFAVGEVHIHAILAPAQYIGRGHLLGLAGLP
jgi:hypothetical protein